MKKYIIGLSFLCFGFQNLYGDTLPAKTYSDPNSKCEVRSSSGEYPIFKIYKNNKEIKIIDCDCYVSVLFSPSGKYIAFGNSEMDVFERKYALSVFKCQTEKIKGYLTTSCSQKSGPNVCISNTITTANCTDREVLSGLSS